MDYKKEAVKQYLKYFLVWFIIIGALAVIAIVVAGVHAMVNNRPRSNQSAPAERVYDYADLLDADQEEQLRSQIARTERAIHMDIVIVTLRQPMEGEAAMQEFDAVSPYLEDVMEAYADNFWDENGYGYNKNFEGDGLILVDNVYEDQGYWQISTSGQAEDELSDWDINDLLDALESRYEDDNPYPAYSRFVSAVERELTPEKLSLPWWLIVLVPIVTALVYAFVNMSQKKAKDTTSASTYVSGGRPVMRGQRDDFIRKNVTQRRISTSSGSGGHSSGHSGGGGHHHSSSGASHGGGGRRH